MSKLEELIAELCPDGVSYHTLGELEDNNHIKLGRGKVISKGYLRDHMGEYPVFSSAAQNNGIIGYSSEYMFSDIRITWSIDGGGKFFFRDNGKYSVTNVCGWLKNHNDNMLNTKYLYYCLYNEWMKKTYDYVHKAHPSVIRDEYKIPLPPLAIQEEIVRILDVFTELKEELKEELKARKEQFLAYSIKIISETKINSLLKIRDFGKWSGGKTPSMNNPEFWNDGIIPWVSSKDMKSPYLTDTKDHVTNKAIDTAGLKLYPKNTIAMVVRSGILKHTLPIAFIPIETTVNQDIKILIPDSQINPKFAFYVLSAYSQEIRIKTKKIGGTVDSLDVGKLMNYELPVPSLEEQNRIVSILDRFDKLCNDISEGLPAEINAREKQYEYYRDQLMKFRQKEVSA